MGTQSDKTVASESEELQLRTVVPQSRPFPMLLGLVGPLRGRRFVLDKQVISIGRDMLADIVIKDSKASRHHARVIYVNLEEKEQQPDCRVFDAGSTNGTLVNGERVEAGGRALCDKDRVQIGKTLFGYFIRDDVEVTPDETFEVLATRDPASGLLNRDVFMRVLNREFERARRYRRSMSLIFFEVATYKRIREEYGTTASQGVLRRLGSILNDALRSHDICARFDDGSRIAILLPETEEENALVRVAERLLYTISQTQFSFGDVMLDVRCHMGVSCIQPGATSTEELAQQTERALQNAQTHHTSKAVSYANMME